MDLSSIKAVDDHVAMRLEHPITGEYLDGEKDPIFYIRPSTSEEVLDAQKRSMKRISKNRKDDVDYEQESTNVLLAVVASWENLEKDGKPFEFSRENLRFLLTHKDFTWIKEQIRNFFNDQSNFFAQS